MICHRHRRAAFAASALGPAARLRLLFVAVILLGGAPSVRGGDDAPQQEKIRRAAEKALPLLEKASAGSADQRKCFTCHSQALPVLAIVAARRHGFCINEANLRRQVTHTQEHLERGRQAYLEGRGQGGGADTAGYALWALDAGNAPGDETTAAVTSWLLDKQQPEGFWRTSSNRPPSEASAFATTYVALRGLDAFSDDVQRPELERQSQQSLAWLREAKPQDTEDHVFRLLALKQLDAEAEVLQSAATELSQLQRADGGWAQTADMESDAYATGSALYAMQAAGGLPYDDPHRQRAAEFLLESQQADGSWHVKSRSEPFQTHYETGFPHGKDQFISTSATAWAVLALLRGLAPGDGADDRLIAETLKHRNE